MERHEDCNACEQVEPTAAHFEAIFDFLEAHKIDDADIWLDLASVRMDLHGKFHQ